MAKLTNAADMARSIGVDPKAFRRALQNAQSPGSTSSTMIGKWRLIAQSIHQCGPCW